MKNIIQLAILILFSISLESCDFFESRDFIIINKTDSEIIIKTAKGSDCIYYADSIHIIEPNKQIKFYEDMGICGRNYYPDDYFKSEELLPPSNKFDIYISDILIKQEIRLRPNWTFKSEKQVGIYTLEITNELLSNQTTN
ncbi:hypothetical protein LJB84_01165 [Bacteroidales bacterium OttesenSCG-928-J19]|nr:hypothetical protein [Bacteroidales bacterium OttesenSCG-928-J19]